MRLYHQPRTRSTRVLWMLEEAGASFDLTVISREDKAAPGYRKLHPLGRSPVIEEEGGAVFESVAIILQIADQHPDAGLIGGLGTHERALHYQWALFATSEIDGALTDVARQLWGDGEPDQAVIAAARVRFATASAVVEDSLAGGSFLVGDRFSVADLTVGAVLGFARMAELAELTPGLASYVDALEARPARQRAVAVTA